MKDTKRPIVGVFVSHLHINKLLFHLERFQSSSRYIRFIELARANKDANVILYFFSSNDVNFLKNTVKGTFYDNSTKVWKRKIFPLPNILYDRGGGSHTRAQLIRKKLDKLGVKKINSQHYFNKWDMYQKLNKLNEIKPFLPITLKGLYKNNLVQLFQESERIYIKGCTGSRGKKVMRVEMKDDHGYLYKYYRGGKVIEESATNMEDLIRKLTSFYKNKNVIVQQAIDLPTIKNCIVDMRSELHRNNSGNIEIIGIIVRVGRPNSPIASNTTNAHYYPFEEFFKNYFDYSKEHILKQKKKIENFLIKTYRAIEHCYGRFGDLGIDFGVDKKGRIWLIECNAKSAKVALYKAYEQNIAQKLFLYPLLYSKYMLKN